MNATIFGQRFDAQGQPLATIFDQSAAPWPTAPFLHTGIKVLDVFAPIAWRSCAGIMAQAGVGKLVLLMELVERTARMYGGGTILLSSTTPDGQDVQHMLLEAGVEQHVAHVVVNESDDQQAALQTCLTLLQKHTETPTLLLIDCTCLADQPAAALATLRNQLAARHVAVFFDHQQSSLLEDLDLDSYVFFSQELAKEKIWPAIDPLRSTSRLLQTLEFQAQQQLVAQLQQALEHDAALADQLRAFGSQPFFTAEPFTARPGIIVPLNAALSGYQTLLAGTYTQPLETLMFQGALPQ